MADVLSFQVLTPRGVYPSVNHLSLGNHRGGKKTPEYHELMLAVREAARAEMERVGWETADYYVDVYWKRYITTRRQFDAMNGMKCELDAMEPYYPTPEEIACGTRPFLGVYANDSLVRPHPDIPQVDLRPGSVDRIAISVFRLFPSILDLNSNGVKTTRVPKIRGKETRRDLACDSSEIPAKLPTKQITIGERLVAYLNGVPIPYEDGLAMVRGSNQYKRTPRRKT